MTQTVLDQYAEIHSAQIGLLVGAFAGLVYRRHPYISYAVILFAVTFGFGKIHTIEALTPLRREPWYFLTAAFASTTASILIVTFTDPVQELLAQRRPFK